MLADTDGFSVSVSIKLIVICIPSIREQKSHTIVGLSSHNRDDLRILLVFLPHRSSAVFSLLPLFPKHGINKIIPIAAIVDVIALALPTLIP